MAKRKVGARPPSVRIERHREYRYAPARTDDRAGESCEAIRPVGWAAHPEEVVVRFADGEERVVPSASLRVLNPRWGRA